MVRLLALQLLDPLIQPVNLRLCALADGALSFAIVCAFPRKLLGCEVCDATGGGTGATLLRGGLARILTVILLQGRCRRIGFAWGKGRHGGWESPAALQLRLALLLEGVMRRVMILRKKPDPLGVIGRCEAAMGGAEFG